MKRCRDCLRSQISSAGVASAAAHGPLVFMEEKLFLHWLTLESGSKVVNG